MLSLFAIFLSLTLLMLGAYRGWSVLVLAPLLASLAVLISGDLPLMATYTQIFMTSLGNFTVNYFPLFLLGSIFGKLMEESGFARSVARGFLQALGSERAIVSIVLSCGLLTYGGVSAFVVVFTIYPLAAALFWETKTPKRLIPACIAAGALTFSMTALPGTAQIHNLIPMSFFGTTAFAAPALGIVAGLMMFAAATLWLQRQCLQARSKQEGYGYEQDFSPKDLAPAHFALSLLPILCVIGANYLFSEYWIPSWNTEYLSTTQFGGSSLSKLRGTWSMILALLLGIFVLVLALLFQRRFRKIPEAFNSGALSSLLPTFNTASEVGYGATIAALAGFAMIRDGIFAFAPDNPIIAQMISINILSGITGSASGGLSIALGALGEQFLELGRAAGISPETLHRVASLSSGGLDTLPHNGAVITLLAVCGLSHRESYRDICVVSLVVPVVVTLICVLTGVALGLFS